MTKTRDDLEQTFLVGALLNEYSDWIEIFKQKGIQLDAQHAVSGIRELSRKEIKFVSIPKILKVLETIRNFAESDFTTNEFDWPKKELLCKLVVYSVAGNQKHDAVDQILNKFAEIFDVKIDSVFKNQVFAAILSTLSVLGESKNQKKQNRLQEWITFSVSETDWIKHTEPSVCSRSLESLIRNRTFRTEQNSELITELCLRGRVSPVSFTVMIAPRILESLLNSTSTKEIPYLKKLAETNSSSVFGIFLKVLDSSEVYSASTLRVSDLAECIRETIPEKLDVLLQKYAKTYLHSDILKNFVQALNDGRNIRAQTRIITLTRNVLETLRILEANRTPAVIDVTPLEDLANQITDPEFHELLKYFELQKFGVSITEAEKISETSKPRNIRV